MGALFGVNGGKESVRDALSAPISDPIMYQLVRVEGDGRLIPATDDEVIEVDHLLEDNKIGMFSVEDLSHSEVDVSNEVLSSKKHGSDGTKGLSQSETAAIKSQKLSARLEYIEVILRKVKQEERLRLSCESLPSFPNYMDVDCKLSDRPDNSLPADEKLQMRNISKETTPYSVKLNDNYSAQSEGAETCSVPATLPLSASELPASLKPDLSISKGENFLEYLTVTELQEVFKTTFGRPTTVKDKSWLKRRIAMGLGNSYDPLTNSVIKDKPPIQNTVKEQSFCRVQDGEFKSGSPSIHRDNESTNNPCLKSSIWPTNNSKDCPMLSGKKLIGSVEECDAKSAAILMEQFALKRVRKPTKRYIEQLSEVESRESTDTLSCSEKTSGHGQSSPLSRAMTIDNIGSCGKTFVTRQDYIGGVDIQIPYVYRVRRGRPRKNFMALMKTVVMESKTSIMEAPGSDEEQESKHRKTSLSENFSDENTETLQDCKSNARRKHHRAWTLGEVMKLIDGVAQYGTGRWSEIKRVSFASHSHRTSVDLKDKWRNLLKASFAQGPMDKGIRKHTSVAIPTPILMRVKELAELQLQPGAEFGPSKPAIDSGKSVQEKESGFL